MTLKMIEAVQRTVERRLVHFFIIIFCVRHYARYVQKLKRLSMSLCFKHALTMITTLFADLFSQKEKLWWLRLQTSTRRKTSLVKRLSSCLHHFKENSVLFIVTEYLRLTE